MKRAFWDVCLLIMAGAAILCMFALLLAVFQIPNTAGIDNSFVSQIATAAFEFVESQHNAVIWAAVILLVVLPVGAKILPRLHQRNWNLRSEASRVHPALRGPSILSGKSNVLNPNFRRGDDQVGLRNEASLRGRQAS